MMRTLGSNNLDHSHNITNISTRRAEAADSTKVARRADAFDWSCKEAIAVPHVDAIAVYTNEDGDIIIRQEGGPLEADAVVTVPAQIAHRVIEALRRELLGPSPSYADWCRLRFSPSTPGVG